MFRKFQRFTSAVLACSVVIGSVVFYTDAKRKVVNAAETKYDSANLVNYATIMGRAVDYGIVSQSLTQSQHMETTFATFTYRRTVDTTTDIDLTNAKTAQFIIGEITSRPPNDTLKFGKVRTSSGQVFVENMRITMSDNMDPNRSFRFQDDVAQTTQFNYSYLTRNEIQESIDTVIDHARDESGEMVTRTKDKDYVLDASDNNLVSVKGGVTTININDDKYENKVVYINLDDRKFESLLRDWKREPNGHHLDINKRSSTVIVFTSQKKDPITLGKVTVYAPDSPLYSSAASAGIHDYDAYASVTTYSGNQSSHNAYVDREIAQKLIWNVTNSKDITISGNAGTFLFLAGDKNHRDVKVKLNGSPCAGWIVANGNVQNECEYHYIYGGNSQGQQSEGNGQMHFVARKGFATQYADKDHIAAYTDNTVAFNEGDYQFFWQEYTNSNFDTPIGNKSVVKVKDTSYLEFPTETFTNKDSSDPHYVTSTPTDFYFRITEDPSKSLSGIKNSAGYINICLRVYVAAKNEIKFKVQSVTMIGDDENHLIQYDKNGTLGSANDWVDVVNSRFDLGAFFNREMVPGYMTITKTIEGDVTEEDLNGLTFTVTDGKDFTVVYKLGRDFTKNPSTGIYELTTPIQVPDSQTTYSVTETLYSLDGYKLEEVSYKVDGGATQHNSDEATLGSVSTDSNNPTTVAYTDSYTPLGTLTVKKTAKDNNNHIINYYYEFSVKNSEGKFLQDDKQTFDTQEVFFTIGTDEEVVFNDLPVGVYTITENTTGMFVYGYTFEETLSTTSGPATVTKKANTDFTLNNVFTQDLGFLTVKKTATDNNGNNVEGTFQFTISTPMRGYLQDDGTFSDQKHYFTIKAGESMTFDDLPADNYMITEDTNSVAVTGYTFNMADSKYSVLGKVTKNGNANAELVNKYTQDLGTLRVTKTATDDNNASVSGTFEFSVKNSKDKYLQADKQTFDDGEVFFTVEAGSYTIFDDIPTGEYTITEKTDSISVAGYTFTSTGSTTSTSATVTKGGTVDAELINNFNEVLGSLTVGKVVNGAPANAADKDYEFTVTGPNGFSDTFTLKNGETKTLSDLHLGTYTVTENGVDAEISGYTLVVSGEGDVELTTSGVDGYATVTNDYTEILGSLTVEKVVNGAPATAADKDYEFTVTGPNGFSDTFSLKAGETKTLSDLHLGTYTVTENRTDAQISGYTLVVSGEGSVELTTANVDRYATVTNDYTEILGSLTVEKIVSGAPASAAGKEFEFTVSGPNNYSETFTLKAGETKTLTDLHLGTYTVTETGDAGIEGYLLVTTGSGADVTLTSTKTDESVTVTNDYTEILGSLTVKKEVTGAPSTAADKEYEFTVSGPNNYSETFTLKAGETKTLNDLHLGAYTVTENETDAQISGYDLLVSGNGTSKVLTTVNKDETLTVTNDYSEILGSLTVKKEVTGAPATATGKDYEFTVTGPNNFSDTFTLKAGETKTLSDLHLGTYTVTENRTDAEISGYTLVVNGEDSIELTTANVDGYATVTNDYTEILGSLTVEKVVNGAPSTAADKDYEFTVTGPNGFSDTFTLKNGETMTLSDLHLGKYTVTENGFDAEISGYTLVVSGEGDVELTTASVDGYAIVTNDYTEILGSLTVEKVVNGAPSTAADKDYEFTVTGPNGFSDTFTLKDGETKTLNDLHLGTYTVTENDADAEISGYTLVVSGEGDVELTTASVDGYATVTNDYTEILGSLTVEKVVNGAPSTAADKDYEFTVTGPNGFSDTFTLKAGETKTLSDLHLGTYTVTENEADAQISGYDLVVSSNGPVDLTETNKDVSATVTNDYTEILGSLTVKKEVTGAPSSEANKTFEFTVTGPDNFSDTFTLQAGETMTLADLHLGKYTITETGDAGIEGYLLVTSGSGAEVTLTSTNKDGYATVTNDYTEILGTLTVKKEVTGAPSNEANKTFKFTVDGPNNYSETFELKAGETKTLTDLHLGTYTVTENETDAEISGYDLVVSGNGTSKVLTTVNKDETLIVTNDYTEILGSLTVKKEVTGAPSSEANKTFEFTVTGPNGFSDTFTLKNGETKTLSDLHLGTYTVTENGVDAEISGYTLVVSGEGDVELTAANVDGYATIQNDYTEILGSLTIEKVVSGAPGSEANKTFEFTVTGPNGFSDTFTLKAGETMTLSDLHLGTYTVTENGVDAEISGYTLVVSGEGDVELTTASADGYATVTNDYTEILGSLMVEKVVNGAPSTAAGKDYEFTVTGPNGFSDTFTLKDGETKTLSDLKLGTYTVTENGADAEISGYTLVVSGEGDVDLTKTNKDVSATVTNDYTEILGSLTVEKVVSGAPGSEANKTFEFTVTGPNGFSDTFTLKDGETKTLNDLHLGTYTVTENETDAQITGYDLVVSGTGDVELTSTSKDGTATVKNTYSDVKGSLTIGKTVSGAPSNEANKTFEFTVEGPNNYNEKVYLKDGETKTLSDLTLGKYTVTENRTDAQISGYDLVVSGTGDVELTVANVNGATTVTNTYTEILGSLTVKKEVTGAPSTAADKDYEFKVTGPDNYSETFKLKAGETKTLSDLKLGTYTVSEIGDASIEGYLLVTSGSGAQVTLTSANKDETASVKNAYTEILGSLTVGKTVSGAPSTATGKDYAFKVTGPDNYIATFTLKDGETKTLSDLHLGTYTVTEDETDAQISGYDLLVTGSGERKVLTTVNQNDTLTVTNAYTEILGSLTVKKEVTGAPSSASGNEYEFTVSGPEGYSETFKLKDGETTTLNDLKLGQYTVTENEANAKITGYNLVVSGTGDVTLTASAKDGSATVKNAYSDVKGSLTVGKTVTGAPSNEVNKVFEFTVEGPNNYSETVYLKDGETKTLSDLQLGQYTITENRTDAQIIGYNLVVSGENPVTLTASAKDGSATVKNAYTEILGSLTVKKEVTGAPSSASGNEYEFTVTGPDGYSETFKLKAGETKTLSDLKLGTYTVTEDEADAKITGFDLVVSGNGTSKALTTSNKNDSVTVKNTYSDVKGSLTVGKTVTGAPSNEANKIFEFTVEGPNNYSETVYLKDGETKTLSDLTLGTYTITENRTDAQITGYDLVVSGENPVTLTASTKDGSATVKNVYTEILGSLTVKKEVTGAPSSASGNEYEFTVTNPEGYSATFKLKDGETKTLSDLKLGTYTVTENEANAKITGFDLVVSGTGDVTLTASAKDGSATVKNAYSDVKGSLTIGKTVTGAPSNEANKIFEFTVEGPNNYNETVYLKDGETKLLTDLTLGTYTITENEADAKIAGYDLVVSGENPVTLTTSAKDGSVTVKNAYTEIKGSLTVKKEVTGAPSSASTKEYEFTVTNPDGYSATFTLKAGETKTLSDLSLNTYTVTENETDAQIKGYTLAVTGTGTVELTVANRDGSATVKNAYTDSNEKTSVSVQKVWNDNNNQNGDRPASLTVTLSNGQTVVLNDGNSWTQTVSGLPKYENGSEIVYTWTEEQVQGYTMSSITTDASDPTKTVITNDYDASSVQTSATIKKVWDDNNDAAGVRPASLVVYLFKNGTKIDTCTLNEANGWTATVNNLEKYDTSNNPYSYTWTEETVTVAGYAEDGTTVSDTTTTITNKYTAPAPVLGSLKIKKVLASGAPTDASSKTYHFTVTGTKGYTKTVDIQGAGEAVLDNLEQDTYTITEDTSSADIDGYTLSVSNNGATVVINSAAQQECEITNTYTQDVQPTSTQPSDTTPTDTQPTGTQPSDTTPTGTQPTSTKPTSTQPTGTKPTSASPDDDEQAPSENTPTPDTKPSGTTTTPTPDKEIESVTIDDKPVTPEDYTKKPDGTVEFSSRTIEGLTLGVHRAVIKYKDGTTVTVEFEVITSARTGRNVVKTGDVAKNNLVPAVALFTVAAAAVAIVIFRRRRSERNAE